MIVDFFISRDIKLRPEYHEKARSLVTFVLTFCVLIVVLALGMWFSAERSYQSSIVLLSICVPLCVLYLMTLGLFRSTGQLRLCSHLVMLWTISFGLFSMHITGGPVESPIRSLVLLYPMFAIFFLGTRDGLIWSGVVAVVFTAMLGLAASGHQFVQMMEVRHLSVNHTITWCIAFFGIAWLCWRHGRLLAQVAHERDRNEQRLEYLMEFDVLTGLLSRRAFMHQLREVQSRHARYKNRFALFVVNIKEFSKINSEYGNVVGDHILVAVSQRLSSLMASNDVLGRLGSDEWGIVIPKMTLEEDAPDFARSIREKLNDSYKTEVGEVDVSVSVGFSVYPDKTEDRDEMFRYASEMRRRKPIKALWGSNRETG